jgi:hypothetical protein
MKLFWWSSEAFREYGSGRILVVAATAEEARKKAMADAGRAFLEKRHWDDDNWLLQLIAEDDMEDYRAFLTILARDLEAEPVTTTETVFMRGSD